MKDVTCDHCGEKMVFIMSGVVSDEFGIGDNEVHWCQYCGTLRNESGEMIHVRVPIPGRA